MARNAADTVMTAPRARTGAQGVAAVKSSDGKIGVFLAAVLVAGNMIGSGVYLLPAVLAGVGGVSLLGWGVATAGALILALMYAGFAHHGLDSPGQEGLIGRIAEGLGPFWGYQAAALYSVACWVGNVAIALAVTGYAASFFAPLKETGASVIFTLAVIVGATALNVFGSRFVSQLQGATLLLGLAPVILIGVGGWLAFKPALFAAQWNVVHASPGQVLDATMLPIFWAFLGLETAAICAVRVREPERNLAKATVLGVAAAGAVYAGACVVLLGIMPAKAIAASTAPFADGAQVMLGVGLGAVVAVCAMIRASGTLAGWVLMTAETAQSAVASGLFPRFLASPGPKATVKTLTVALLIMAAITVLSAAPALAQQFTVLIDVAVLLSLGMYILSAAALWRLSAKDDSRRRHMVRIACALSIAFCAGVLITADRTQQAWTGGIVLAAAIAYFASARRMRKAA